MSSTGDGFTKVQRIRTKIHRRRTVDEIRRDSKMFDEKGLLQLVVEMLLDEREATEKI